MQSHKSRQYTAACRHEAVRLIPEQGYGVTEAARNLGSTAHMLGRWQRQIAPQNNGVYRGNGPLAADQEELPQLRKAVKRLRMERAIWKQAALFFAHESR
jgi:transposase